jgi:hypothetical protein
MFQFFLTKENYDIKTTKSAAKLISFVSFLRFVKREIIQIFSYLYSKKQEISMGLLIILVSNGFLFVFIRELIIFFIYYMLAGVNLNLHMIFWYMFKSIVLFTYLNIPLYILVPLIFLFGFNRAIVMGYRKGQKNHDSFKVFARFELGDSVIINGKPSAGKNRFGTPLALIMEENLIDELEENIHAIESDYPDVNFGYVVSNPGYHQEKYPDHYKYTQFLNRKTSFLMTLPLAILDPYSDGFSHKLKWPWLRPGQPCEEAPLEEWSVLVASEVDKEYSSHFNMKDVGEDGFHITAGTITHWGNRHIKIVMDYQIGSQLPRNVRANFQSFIYVHEFRYKMPFLINLYSLPFKALFVVFDQILNHYKYYKQRLFRGSFRKSKRIRKRYDMTFFYVFFKYLTYYTSRILNWFSKFLYIRYKLSFTDEEENIIKNFKMNINHIDEQYRGSRLYDSTFIHEAYIEKKNAASKKSIWDKLETYNSLTPSRDDLLSIGSRFLEDMFLKKPSPATERVNTTKRGDTNEKTKDFEF